MGPLSKMGWGRARRLRRPRVNRRLQLPRSQAHATGQFLDIAIVERSFSDQSQRARNHRRCAQPGGRARGSRGTAAAAGMKSRCLCSGSRGKPQDVAWFSKWNRTGGSAIDARRYRAREEPSVESCVAAVYSLPAYLRLQTATARVSERLRKYFRSHL